MLKLNLMRYKKERIEHKILLCYHCRMEDNTKVIFAELVARAVAAARNAYCPYSNYRVGAAALAEDGTVFVGCNVENASYGLTVCAERNAVFAAVASGVRKIKAVALVAGSVDAPATPCGACRQVLAEFCAPETPVCCATLEGEIVLETTVGELLPAAFALKQN